METFLIYIDESHDQTNFVYSALFVSVSQWESCFKKILEWRHKLKEEHDIPYQTELHATEFVGGKGIRGTSHDKDYRADLFHSALQFIETLEEISILNGITENKIKSKKLFEWMIARINASLRARNSYGILVCDEGEEGKLIPLVREMKTKNIVPSHFEGERSAPLNNIVEDPLFKNSKSSYFIQMADFVAFALLRKEHPLEKTHPKVQSAFDQLDKRLIKEAYGDDPKGIVRVW